MKYKPEEDGITHINIYSKSKTELGRYLSNWTICNLELALGNFRTIEGLIFYLGCFDDRLKKTGGYDSKKLGEQLDRGQRIPEKDFRGYIVDAMIKKIERAPEFREQFKESTLPLTHYYVYGTKVINIPKWDWQVREWEKIRGALK
jgi:hypothetical protein